MVEKYKIDVTYDWDNIREEFRANIVVSLPVNARFEDEIDRSYIDLNVYLLCERMHPTWGFSSCKGPYRTRQQQVEHSDLVRLQKNVVTEIESIQDTIHRVFTKNQDSASKSEARLLPSGIHLDIDPSYLEMPLGKPVLSPLENWQRQLSIGDRIAIPVSDSERLSPGKIEYIEQDKFDSSKYRIELLIDSGETKLLLVDPSSILPCCCERRSDEWRCNFKVGDILSWRSPDRADILRSDIINEIEYDFDAGEVTVLWGKDHGSRTLKLVDLIR